MQLHFRAPLNFVVIFLEFIAKSEMSTNHCTKTPWVTYLRPIMLPPDAFFIIFSFSLLIYTLFLYMIRRHAPILHNAYTFIKHHNNLYPGMVEDV